MPSAKSLRRASVELDGTDRKILSALHSHGRMTINELAERVGLSPSPCWTRVKRLETDGIIEGYAAVIALAALGLRETVFVEITLQQHDDLLLQRFGSELAKIPEVLEVHLVAGEYDYLAKVAVIDALDYDRFLRERLYKIEGIRNARSTFALRTLKCAVSVDPLAIA
jgi:Lrp/AsnC family transcriptional regulator, leucine-responsive regulatory protein